MKIQEFIDLVAQLRVAQKAYFRTRSYTDLCNCKILEQQVDNALRFIGQDDNQLSLFQ